MGPGIGFRDKVALGCDQVAPRLKELQWGPELGSGISPHHQAHTGTTAAASMGPGIGFRDKPRERRLQPPFSLSSFNGARNWVPG